MRCLSLFLVLLGSVLTCAPSAVIALPPNLKISDVPGDHPEFTRLRTHFRNFRTGEQELRAQQRTLSTLHPDVWMSCVEKAVSGDREITFRTFQSSFHFVSVVANEDSKPWPGVYVFDFKDTEADRSLLKHYLNASSVNLRKARTEKALRLAKEEAEANLDRLSYFSLASPSITPRREEEETKQQMAMHFGDPDGLFPLLVSVVRTPHGYLRARMERLGLNDEVLSIAYCESKSIAPTIQVLSEATRALHTKMEVTPLTNISYQIQFTTAASLEKREDKHTLNVTQKSPFHLTLSGSMFGVPLKWEIVASEKDKGAILGADALGKVQTRFSFSTNEKGDVEYIGTAFGNESQLTFRSRFTKDGWQQLFDGHGELIDQIQTFSVDRLRFNNQILINAGLAAARIAFDELNRQSGEGLSNRSLSLWPTVLALKELPEEAREKHVPVYLGTHASRLSLAQVVALISQCRQSSRFGLAKAYFDANSSRIQLASSIGKFVDVLPREHQHQFIALALEVHAQHWDAVTFDELVRKSPAANVSQLVASYINANREKLSCRDLQLLISHGRPHETEDILVAFFSTQARRIDPAGFLALVTRMKVEKFTHYQTDPIILSYVNGKGTALRASELILLQREVYSPEAKAVITELLVGTNPR